MNKLKYTRNKTGVKTRIMRIKRLKSALETIMINRFIPSYDTLKDWQAIAGYIHDNLSYSQLYVFPKSRAFKTRWHEKPVKGIDSRIC